MIKECIFKLKAKTSLTPAEMEGVMQEIMSGSAEKQDIADFLLALREKGAIVDEITAAAKIMRKFFIPVETDIEVVLDTCGTGGDKKGTFNISTIAALVVAGQGVVVAKHGNRSVSSCCGSADVLEALGVNVNMETSRLKGCLEKVGIAFLFAQSLHPAMKHAAPIRKELGVETIFNVLGPLTNPAKATHQMMGVYTKDLVEPLANVLKNLGLKRAMVVHGSDGLDEVTTNGITFASELREGRVTSYTINPADYGIKNALPQDLRGGSLEINARIFREILEGATGPKRDIAILNAGCALYLAEKAETISSGIKLAEESIDKGLALKKLEELIEFSQKNER